MFVSTMLSRSSISRRSLISLPVWILLLAACTSQPQQNREDVSGADSAASTAARSELLAQSSLIVDTHVDVPYRIFRRPDDDVSGATSTGQFDYPRAKQGGLNAPFMSIYVPSNVDEAGEGFDFANDTIDVMLALSATHPDKFATATCTDDVYKQFTQGLISLPMGMENGGPIGGEIANLEHFFDRGIRYITLAHAKSNHISDSSYDPNEPWQGLSPFGQALIPQMNRLGVMVDVSHISDLAFWQVLEHSKTPVIASHSSLRHFTPEFQRNMSDAMVQAMAAAGGVIQINFGSSFISQAARDYSNNRITALREYQMTNHVADGDPSLLVAMQTYTANHPYPFASLNDVLDHIDRAVEIAGIDAVGIGSDFDGVGDTLPTDLKDVASLPNLIDGLLQRGYSEPGVQKILGGNLMRVWRQIETYARSQGTKTSCAS